MQEAYGVALLKIAEKVQAPSPAIFRQQANLSNLKDISP